MTFEEWLAQTGLDPADAWWVLALYGVQLPEQSEVSGEVSDENA